MPFLDFGNVLLGGLILYLGAEWLVKGSAGLARSYGVKPVVIGLTVVAYGTSAPELAVGIAANIDGTSPMVLGTVVGSCIANLGLVLGLTALLSPPEVDGQLIRRELPVLLLSAICLPIMLHDGSLSRIDATILTALAVVFTVVTLSSAKEDVGYTAEEIESNAEAAGAPTGEGRARLVAITIVGLALLIGGGELFVRGARGVAEAFGLSERFIGLTVVAVGTSLPELAASVVAALRGHAGLAVGNVIGSNIFNIFLVLGGSGLVRPLPGDLGELRLDLGFMAGITVLGILLMRGTRTISRAEGAFLVACYLCFIVLAAAGW